MYNHVYPPWTTQIARFSQGSNLALQPFYLFLANRNSPDATYETTGPCHHWQPGSYSV